MSADLFRQYIDIINENSNEKPDEKGPNAFQKAYHSGEGPLPPEPMEIIDDTKEIADMIHQAYNMPDSSDPEQNAHNADIRKLIKAALLQLNPKEERIIRMRFGIGVPEMTLDAIGQKFGVTGQAIRSIEAKAIRKLRHPSHILRKSDKTMPPYPLVRNREDHEKFKPELDAYMKAYSPVPTHLE